MTLTARKYVVFGAFATVSLVLDQWTKSLARADLAPLGHRGKVVIDGFFNLRYSENTGVAFGMLQKMPGIVLTLIALVAFGLVVSYLRKTPDDQLRIHIALGLVGGGAIGNLLDRIMFGRVTDFIVWYYKSHEWPAFNIADAALVVGVGLMLLDMFKKQPQPAADPAKAK